MTNKLEGRSLCGSLDAGWVNIVHDAIVSDSGNPTVEPAAGGGRVRTVGVAG